MSNALPAGFLSLLSGRGYTPPPSAGNRANAPAQPPVQAGSYEYIQGSMYPVNESVSAPFHVPPAFRDWAQFEVGAYDPSGLIGGGVADDAPMQEAQGSVFYDPTTGQFYSVPGTEAV